MTTTESAPPLFTRDWLPDILSTVFSPVPDVPIPEWAETAFALRKSPEPAFRQSRTPWTRRGAELIRVPWSDGRRIRRVGVKKSSQSGYSESIVLNPIRWFARYSPRNCIVSVDSQKEVANISERLIPTLRDIGPGIFTGKEDDITKFKITLRGMDIWFAGSFSPGAPSNKFCPFVANDEVDLYEDIAGEGDTIDNFWTRAKTVDEGFQVVLSKPAMKGGPIDTFFHMGNQEEWEIECPHHGCRQRYPMLATAQDWQRVEFTHCKELMGDWDLERVLRETFYRCPHCGGKITDADKPLINSRAQWIATAKGDPEIVTQHMSDVPSMYAGSTLGHLAKQFIQAQDDREKMQSFHQQRLGLAWEEQVSEITAPDILKLRRPYRRGTIPEKGCKLAIGMDIGGITNTRILVYAFNRAGECWLLDWSHKLTGPADVIPFMKKTRYPCAETGAAQPIDFAFLDARYRKEEVYETCLLAPRQIFPCMGVSARGVRSISMEQVPGKPLGFAVLKFNKQDAHYDLYIDKVRNQKLPGFYWPENLEDILIKEHTAERLIRKKGRLVWDDDHRRPNHYGDCTELALAGIEWLTGGRRARVLADALAAKTPDSELSAEDFEK